MSCPVCTSTDLLGIFQKDAMPCYNLERHPSRASALAARSGRIDSKFCRSCGFTFNAAFDASIMNYQVDYENSRSHSPRYRAYIEHIAQYVSSHVPADAKHIVEVGCGGAEFLEALRPHVSAELWGYDPAIPTEVTELEGIHLVRDYYMPNDAPPTPDMLVLRHTLEHIANPYTFLRSLIPPDGQKPLLYIEVPAWEWIAERHSFYSFSYEHCSYYSRRAMAHMLAQLGYRVRECEFDFDGEYIRCIAEAGDEQSTRIPLGALQDQSERFAKALPSLVKNMRCMFTEKSALWGAAGKGTTLLNLIDAMYTDTPVVIDSSPRRAHTFIPRTGQEVILPSDIKRDTTDRILLTNSAYKDEMAASLALLDLHPEIVGLDEYLYRSVT